MNENPVVLAIEASQRQGGVAVRDPQGKTHVETLRSAARHDDDLLAAIDRLYERLGLSPSQTGAIGVSVGPGGFSGLRIAVSTAKMMAEALGATIVAVPTALVVAESHEAPGPIVVGLASKGDGVWATRLQRGAGGIWTIDGKEGLVDADSIWLNGIKALLGDEHLPPSIRDRCRVMNVAVVEPIFSPLACLAVAWRRLRNGRTTDPLHLTPIYARPPATTVKRQRP